MPRKVGIIGSFWKGRKGDDEREREKKKKTDIIISLVFVIGHLDVYKGSIGLCGFFYSPS